MKVFNVGQIGNADQTPVYWDMPSSYTVTLKGVKSVPIRSTGNEKQRCTVMPAITADGKILPPYVILERKLVPKNIKISGNLMLRAQQKGWMEKSLVLDFIRKVWCFRPGGLRKTNSILVWDSFKAHLTDKVKKELQDANTNIIVIPGGLTSILQPLDVCINKPFKDKFRKKYSDWMAFGEHSFTPAGKMKKPSVQNILDWINQAWDEVETDTIQKSFKKCGISNNMDGTKDDLVWDTSCSEESSTSMCETSESDDSNNNNIIISDKDN